MKHHTFLLAAPLVLVAACGPVTEANESTAAAEPATEPVSAEAPAPASADRWSAEKVPYEGDRELHTWRVKLGEAATSITYGFVGSGGQQQTMSKELLGATGFDFSVELVDVDATELMKDLEVLGAKEDDMAALEEGLSETDTIRYVVRVTIDSETSTGGGILPGATRDSEVWAGGMRSVKEHFEGTLGQPETLAWQHWGNEVGSRTPPVVRRAAGPAEAAQIARLLSEEAVLLPAEREALLATLRELPTE